MERRSLSRKSVLFYRNERARPAFVFEKQKTSTNPQTFITILYPYSGNTAPAILVKENAGNDFAGGHLNLSLTINSKVKQIKANLK
ncbi:hypothetical protein G7074_12505 [Pedobacter sp. HDW13]|uniref:hypothetical protein n=1 Tax=Pedobacter sp. HDW13 TaxID=2714940 RepID=UPI000FA37439|nr:hypothetical protein [Pedobacter sp. HDW13]QIL40013.1 hypothetical protein G7074_12505 [Pedobacter sp. HDW13]RQO65118.1 hypothetical protein DBR40_24000 [Pedobacter sp. KBW01]